MFISTPITDNKSDEKGLCHAIISSLISDEIGACSSRDKSVQCYRS